MPVILCGDGISSGIHQITTLYSRYMSRESNSSPARIARMMIHTGTGNGLSSLFHITAVTTWTAGNHSSGYCTWATVQNLYHYQHGRSCEHKTTFTRLWNCKSNKSIRGSYLLGSQWLEFWRNWIRHPVHFVLNRALQNVLLVGPLWKSRAQLEIISVILCIFRV